MKPIMTATFELPPSTRELTAMAAVVLVTALWGAPPLRAERLPTALTAPAVTASAPEGLRSPAAYARFVARGSHRDLSPEDRERFFLGFARSAPAELAAMWRAVGGDVSRKAGELAAPRLESLALGRVSRVSREDQLGMMLGQGAHRPSSKQVRKDRTRAIRALAGDPALVKNFARIEDRWLERLLVDTAWRGLLYATAEELVEVKVLIARNLFFSDGEVTRVTVRAEFRHLLDLRERYGGVPVFSGREVVLVASDQRTDRGAPPIFGGSGLRGSLAKEAVAVTSYGGGAPTATTDEVLSELESVGRLTFVFTGHGRPGALKYRGALKVRELALALAEHSRGTGEPVIAVVLACRSHDFARNLLDAFERLAPGLPKPILITPEEYGQPWVKTGYGSELSRSLGSRAEAVTLGDLGFEWGRGASVFVPGENNVPQQIF